MLPGMQIFDRRVCRLGEGPHYDEYTGQVRWVDILGEQVLWRSPASGETGVIEAGADVGAAVPRVGGGLVLCLPTGPVLLDPDGTREPAGSFAVADAAAERRRGSDDPALRANDAKAGPDGRLWLGTMAYDETPGAAALYRLDPGADVPVRVVNGLTISNGLGWSPDGKVMYHIDTPTSGIDIYDYDSTDGSIARRRRFATIEPGAGYPDGMCMDADGGVWVALWGGGAVRRYLPDGTLDRVVEVGTPQVTSCAFVGEGYPDLVITTAAVGRDGDDAAGLTYLYRPGDVVGTPPDRFAA